MKHINKEIEQIDKHNKEFDEDGYSYYDSFDHTSNNYDYEVLTSAVKNCEQLNKDDVINLVDKYGFKIRNGIEEYDDYEGENLVLKTRKTYETIDNVLKDKVDFDITKDKDIMLKAVNQNENNIDYVSDENLKKDLLNFKNTSDISNENLKELSKRSKFKSGIISESLNKNTNLTENINTEKNISNTNVSQLKNQIKKNDLGY